jgi:hypothetical protein
MGIDCPEQLTWEFLTSIWHYPKRIPTLKTRRITLPNTHAVVLNKPAEVKAFMTKIATTKQSGVQ